MGTKRRANCQICSNSESKYTCPRCSILYCSVACFAEHKSASSCAKRPDESAEPVDKGVAGATLYTSLEATTGQRVELLGGDLATQPSGDHPTREESGHQSASHLESRSPPAPDPELRKLSSLKWPYIPDSATTAFPDPLTRDDPKTLTMPQYEAIARSPAIRNALADQPSLRGILRAIDAQRGEEREKSLQSVLGVAPAQSSGFSLANTREAPSQPVVLPAEDGSRLVAGKEDLKALRVLAEAIEVAIRTADGRTTGLIGLDWQDTEN